MQSSLSWDDLAWIRQQWQGPVLVKGVLRPEDARRAVDLGADGVVVSNHGGRQLDTAPATLDVLAGIVEAVGSDTEVLLDGGVRRGTDVVKALCLGARAVLIGRPYVYGLAVGAEDGAAHVLRILRDEMTRAMILLGAASVKQLGPSWVRPARHKEKKEVRAVGDFGHDETVAILRDRRNWGRWGDDDERGTVNLITEEKRRQAAGLVRTGRSVSLSRVFPVDPSPVNPRPALHFMRRADRGDSGSAADFYGVLYHGTASTHLDALCHLWGPDGIYGGRSPDEVIGIERATFGDVDQYRDGIITRGVLLDVPAYRGEEFVSQDRPVQGDELAAICEQGGFSVEPGDAIVVYSGREAWSRHAGRPWGSGETTSPRPSASGRTGPACTPPACSSSGTPTAPSWCGT